MSWQHSQGALNWQTSLSARYTSLHFAPDWTGDLLYNGIAQNAFKDDTAFAWQTDGSYKASDTHTLRAGFYLQHDTAQSNTTSQCPGPECRWHADQQYSAHPSRTTARRPRSSKAGTCRTSGRRYSP